MKDARENEQKRILVLCVDRDGDLGAKAGVKTPVVGREANLNAAVALALKDPEEPDANAMFEVVRIFDRLKDASPCGTCPLCMMPRWQRSLCTFLNISASSVPRSLPGSQF